LLAAFQKRVGGLFDRSFASAALRIVLASAVMGGLVFGLSWLFEGHTIRALVFRFAAALIPVAVGGAAYLVVGKWLGLEEGKTLLRRRRPKKPSTSPPTSQPPGQ
jgi:peptidoglycan biosynthesis protein MviN/MurJ (putative lipid II flippase)